MSVNACVSKANMLAGSFSYKHGFFTLLVETSSKRAGEDNDSVVAGEDAAVGCSIRKAGGKGLKLPPVPRAKDKSHSNRGTVLQV